MREAYAQRFLRQVWSRGGVLAEAHRLAMPTVPKVVLQSLLSEGRLRQQEACMPGLWHRVEKVRRFRDAYT